MRHGWTWGLVLAISVGLSVSEPARGAIIGIDAVHGFDSTFALGTGSNFDNFRTAITGLGHTIVPVSSFGASDLAGLDALILMIPYTQNTHSAYSASEITAVENFTSAGNGLLVMGEGGGGFQPANLNALVASYGITYALNGTENTGHTITNFVADPITAGVNSIGVDFQLRLTTASPSMDLTTNGGPDDALSVHTGPQRAVFLSDTSIFIDDAITFPPDRSLSFGDNQVLLNNIIGYIVPEPGTLALVLFVSLGGLLRRRSQVTAG